MSKVKEIELPEDRMRSLERCDEVIKYYFLTLDNMLPTLKPNDRVVVDKTIYKSQAPQRGDIIVFNPHNTLQPETPQAPLTQRAIGLPGETVKIENGRVYIDGKLYREDDIIRSSTAVNKLIMVPDRSYFVISDNRNNPDGSIITREAIVGKVIWHFSSN
ncbi:MAG: signal peptidase I [Chamaesiphon sp.]|nr:signal peptidase I [Chamaesiphon sp.]